MGTNKEMVEIWGDIVEIRHLLISMAISNISTIGGLLLAPSNNEGKQLFFGLMGSLIGFVISALFIKPKRIVISKEG
ncbi:MAG: hypothetical protein GXY88_09885 [Tissierellia bacterium]|nr:hypothetical protein [Tissierellia bacterium]